MKTYNYGITTYYITILQTSTKKFNRETSQKLMLHFYQLHFVWKSKRKIINNKKLKSNENWLTPQTPLKYSKCLKTYESARLRPRCAASCSMTLKQNETFGIIRTTASQNKVNVTISLHFRSEMKKVVFFLTPSFLPVFR